MDDTFLAAMRTFAHTSVGRNELIPLPLEVFWSIAYAPLYQLVKFHLSPHKMGIGTGRFVLDEKVKEQAFQLVVKALTPTKH
jgi:hypothetical protein